MATAVNTEEFIVKPPALEVEWDWTSSTPMTHLAFILEHFLADWHPSVQITGFIKEAKERIMREHRNTYEGDPNMKVIFTGSFTENVSIPSYLKRRKDRLPTPEEVRLTFLRSDVDMMIEAIGKTVGYGEKFDRRIETDEIRPGYLRVYYADSSTTGDYCLHRNGKVYLSSEKMLGTFSKRAMSKFAGELTTETHGPALTLLGQHSMDSDIVICLPCPEWPQDAEEWKTRERPSGWPSELLRTEIFSAGCHIVPVAHKQSEWKEAEWRFSFAQAETKLCHSLTLTQRKCYMLLKLLAKNELTPPGLVSSYCLKNLFFRCMEKIPQNEWDMGDNMGFAPVFLYLLDELMYALINENLPHYFIPKNNLFAHIPEDFSYELMAKVSKIRRNPIKYLLAFDKIYMFPFSPIKMTFADAFKDITENCNNFDVNMKQCKVIHYNCLDKLLQIYLLDCQFDGAYAISEEISQLLPKLGDGNFTQSPQAIIDSNALQFPVSHAVLIYEYLTSRFPDAGASLYGNLACMYTALFCSEKDVFKKNEYAQKAEKNFQKALDVEDIRGATAVDYTVYLRKAERSAEAIPLLMKILPKEKALESSNYYGESEKESLDENIQGEIEQSEKGVSNHSLIWGFYQLVQCCIESEVRSQALECMDDFSAACALPNIENKPLAFSLLGYSYKSLDMFKKASESFAKALELKPNYSLAENNQMLCDAMALSLDPDA